MKYFYNTYKFRPINTLANLVLVVIFIFVIGINIKIRKMFKKDQVEKYYNLIGSLNYNKI